MPSKRLLFAVLAGLVALLLPGRAGAAGTAVSPSALQGRPLYVTNSLSDNVAGFTVGPDGSPVPNGAPVPTGHSGSAPGAIAIAPDGRTVYVALRDAGMLAAYTVDGSGGLAPLSRPVRTGGDTPFGIAIAPDGRTLYTADLDSGTISVFTIGADGTPRLSGDPVPAGINPRGLAVTPDGRYLYVGHGVPLEEPTDLLDRFAIGADGTLSGRRTVATTGGAGTGTGITPDGRFLYIAATTTDQLFGFRIGADGDLTAAPGSPYSVADHPEGIAVSPDGHELFLASPSQTRPDTVHALSAFTIGDDGALAPVTGSPFTAGAGPVGVAVTPDGRDVYVSHFDGNELYGFSIGAGGVLTRTPGSPVPSGGEAPAFEALAVVPDQGPVAALTTPGPALAGRATLLDATASTDSDGTVARYDWDFGDGTVLADAGPRPQHVYAAGGTFTARVTVTDAEGCSTTRVFTGQAVLCNGSYAASATTPVTVR